MLKEKQRELPLLTTPGKKRGDRYSRRCRVLVAPRLLTCMELRGERTTYTIHANVIAVFSHSLGSSGISRTFELRAHPTRSLFSLRTAENLHDLEIRYELRVGFIASRWWSSQN